MLRFLFPRLTPDASRGAALFEAATAEARQPHWYVAGQVPDTLDGRFRMLATVVAVIAVRLESAGDEGDAASVALTERFIEAMEAEHREIGLGDPTLGKKVRKLVGSLARRVELWRSATASESGWEQAVRASVYPDEPDAAALAHAAAALRELWARLERRDAAAIAQGEIR